MTKGRKEKILLSLDKDNSELVRFLKLETIPFELPKFVELPKGEKELSRRAKLLMLAGLEHLKEKYPKKVEEGKEVKAPEEEKKVTAFF